MFKTILIVLAVTIVTLIVMACVDKITTEIAEEGGEVGMNCPDYQKSCRDNLQDVDNGGIGPGETLGPREVYPPEVLVAA